MNLAISPTAFASDEFVMNGHCSDIASRRRLTGSASETFSSGSSPYTVAWHCSSASIYLAGAVEHLKTQLSRKSYTACELPFPLHVFKAAIKASCDDGRVCTC